MKYVALLAFNKIVVSYPHLVAMHQDVILNCIDEADISIRLLALQLGSDMVNSDNLQSVVNRLMKQLQGVSPIENPISGRLGYNGATEEPQSDSSSENVEKNLSGNETRSSQARALPTEYRAKIIQHILSLCRRESYTNILDFAWYVDILIELVRVLPPDVDRLTGPEHLVSLDNESRNGIAFAVGAELRNVSVRVATVRAYTVGAVSSFLDFNKHPTETNQGAHHIIEFAAWIVGEYASNLSDPRRALDMLLSIPAFSTSRALSAYLQSIPKVLSQIMVKESNDWSLQLQAETSLLLGKVIKFLEGFIKNPDLEVQERAMGYLELFRVAIQAVKAHDAGSRRGPLILSEALPSLFNSQELKPVASTAQKKVPLLKGLDLTSPIHQHLQEVLTDADLNGQPDPETTAIHGHYYAKFNEIGTEPATQILSNVSTGSSHQDTTERSTKTRLSMSTDAARRERRIEDPFYIDSHSQYHSTMATPLHGISNASDQDVDIDSIPIMSLQIGNSNEGPSAKELNSIIEGSRLRNKVLVTPEEIIDQVSIVEQAGPQSQGSDRISMQRGRPNYPKSLLQVDSSGVSAFQLRSEEPFNHGAETRSKTPEDVEMAKALAEVERMRMEMQRASERVQIATDIPEGGSLVRKKKKKKSSPESTFQGQLEQGMSGENMASIRQLDDTVSVGEGHIKKKKRKKAKPLDD